MSDYKRAEALSLMAAMHFAGYIILFVVCALIDSHPYKDRHALRVREYLWRAAVVFLLAAIYHAL